MATAAKAALYDTPEALSLVERMQGGDESAFNQLYATHHKRVLTVIQKYVEEYDTAEHIANGVFAKVWEDSRQRQFIQVQVSFYHMVDPDRHQRRPDAPAPNEA
jgi:hypothetical protein